MDDEEYLGVFRPVDRYHFADNPKDWWDAEKFGMSLFDVFTTLPKQFNLMAIPILDRESFVLETKYVSVIARDRAEFYQLLQSRMEDRREEQTKMFMKTMLRLAHSPGQMELPDRWDRHWGHAMHIARSKSFDAIVRFLAGFLRDEDPEDAIAIKPAAGQHDESIRQPDAASTAQTSEDVPGGPTPEISSRPSSSGSTADKSQQSRTSTTGGGPRTRKRSRTPATAHADEDGSEAQPTNKKMRFTDDDMAKPRAASWSSRRPTSPRARRVHRGQSPSIPTPQPSLSTVSPSTTITPGEASSSDPTEQCGNVSTAPQIHLGNSERQHSTGSGLVHPNEKKKDDGKNKSGDEHTEDNGLATSGPENSQGRGGSSSSSSRSRPRKGKPPSASPRTENSSKIQKPTTSRRPAADRRAPARTTTGQGSRSRGAAQQTNSSSQRPTRRRGAQGGSSFYELDSNGKACSVVAQP